jgi:hypothetical protein
MDSDDSLKPAAWKWKSARLAQGGEKTMVIRIDKGVLRYGLPGLILGIALALSSGIRGPEAAAQTGPSGSRSANSGSADGNKSGGQRPVAGGEVNGTLALITTSGPAQWLYLVDTKDRAFALYRIDPTNTKGVVKLEASRQYKWDLKLEHYNNQAPEPDAIKATVETLGRAIK